MVNGEGDKKPPRVKNNGIVGSAAKSGRHTLDLIEALSVSGGQFNRHLEFKA